MGSKYQQELNHLGSYQVVDGLHISTLVKTKYTVRLLLWCVLRQPEDPHLSAIADCRVSWDQPIVLP